MDGLDPEGDLEALHSVLDQIEETVLICGHTHRPWVVERNGKLPRR